MLKVVALRIRVLAIVRHSRKGHIMNMPGTYLDFKIIKDTVRLQDEKRTWSLRAQVLGEVAPRSYKVVTENGVVIRRNRHDRMRTTETFESQDDQ